MMEMEELVDCAVVEGAETFKEVGMFAIKNYSPMSHIDLTYCEEYYKKTLGEM